MNITRSNWQQLYPFMRDTLAKADLVAVDFEMTGILASPLLRNSILDPTQVRYWKCKENVRRFMPLQLGLCGFHIDGDSVLATPFNIYLYPFTGHESLHQTFLCESGAFNFLAGHSFDFNRTFYDGVFYVSRENEQILNETKKMSSLREQLRIMSTSADPDMLAFVQLHLPAIKAFFSDSQATSCEIPVSYTKIRNQKYLLMETNKLNQEYVVTYDHENIMKRTKMILTKGPKESTEPPVEEIDTIGIRRIVDQLIAQRTPLIFHNGFFDLLHLYDKFLHSLPESHEEFKQDCSNYFSTIYDTKYMIQTSNMLSNIVSKNPQLKNCFTSLEQFKSLNPIISLHPEFTEYKLHIEPDELASSFEHEAGYDALMTGYNFLKCAQLILAGRQQRPFVLNHDKLQFYSNRLPLGSVKLPFNLKDFEDRYHEKNTQIFYISQLQKTLLPQSVLKDHFLKADLGDINLFLSYGQNFEYFMTFQSSEKAQMFQAQLRDGATAIEVGNMLVVVTTFETYKDQLKRRIKDELRVREMPNCLETPIQ